METASPIDTTVQVGGKTAGLIADYGMLVMVGVLFLAVAATALWLTARYFSRRTSEEYIAKDRLVEEAQKRHPELFKKQAKDLPDLRNHRLFPSATKVMRAAEALGSGTDIDRMTRDLVVWTVRAHRDVMQDILDSIYENPAEFDKRVGDVDTMRSKIENAYTEAGAAVRCRLVEDFSFPARIFDLWQHSREESDRLMVEIIDLAMEQSDPYWRMRSILDSVYARCAMLRPNAVGFFKQLPPEVLKDLKYTPVSGVDASTISGFRPKVGQGSGGYAAALFDRPRRHRG